MAGAEVMAEVRGMIVPLRMLPASPLSAICTDEDNGTVVRLALCDGRASARDLQGPHRRRPWNSAVTDPSLFPLWPVACAAPRQRRPNHGRETRCRFRVLGPPSLGPAPLPFPSPPPLPQPPLASRQGALHKEAKMRVAGIQRWGPKEPQNRPLSREPSAGAFTERSNDS